MGNMCTNSSGSAIGPPRALTNYWKTQVYVKKEKKKSEGAEDESNVDLATCDFLKFKSYHEMAQIYEPTKKKKKKKKKKDKTEKQLEDERKKKLWMVDMALKNIGQLLTDRWTRLFMDFLGALLGNITTAAVGKGDNQVGALANCLSAMLATFRFQHHGKRKFQYIRYEMVAPQLLEVMKDIMQNAETTVNDRAREISEWLQELIAVHINVALAEFSQSKLMAKLKDRMLSSIPSALSRDSIAAVSSGANVVDADRALGMTQGMKGEVPSFDPGFSASFESMKARAMKTAEKYKSSDLVSKAMTQAESFKGVGSGEAQKIAEQMKVRSQQLMNDNPDFVALKTRAMAKAEQAKEGVGLSEAQSIAEQMKVRSQQLLNDNPELIALKTQAIDKAEQVKEEGVGFGEVDRIAKQINDMPDQIWSNNPELVALKEQAMAKAEQVKEEGVGSGEVHRIAEQVNNRFIEKESHLMTPLTLAAEDIANGVLPEAHTLAHVSPVVDNTEAVLLPKDCSTQEDQSMKFTELVNQGANEMLTTTTSQTLNKVGSHFDSLLDDLGDQITFKLVAAVAMAGGSFALQQQVTLVVGMLVSALRTQFHELLLGRLQLHLDNLVKTLFEISFMAEMTNDGLHKVEGKFSEHKNKTDEELSKSLAFEMEQRHILLKDAIKSQVSDIMGMVREALVENINGTDLDDADLNNGENEEGEEEEDEEEEEEDYEDERELYESVFEDTKVQEPRKSRFFRFSTHPAELDASD